MAFERDDQSAIHERVPHHLPATRGNMTPGAKQTSEGVLHTSHSTMSMRLPGPMHRSAIAASARMFPHLLPLHTEG